MATVKNRRWIISLVVLICASIACVCTIVGKVQICARDAYGISHCSKAVFDVPITGWTAGDETVQARFAVVSCEFSVLGLSIALMTLRLTRKTTLEAAFIAVILSLSLAGMALESWYASGDAVKGRQVIWPQSNIGGNGNKIDALLQEGWNNGDATGSDSMSSIGDWPKGNTDTNEMEDRIQEDWKKAVDITKDFTSSNTDINKIPGTFRDFWLQGGSWASASFFLFGAAVASIVDLIFYFKGK